MGGLDLRGLCLKRELTGDEDGTHRCPHVLPGPIQIRVHAVLRGEQKGQRRPGC